VSSMEVYGFGSSPYVDDKGKGAGKRRVLGIYLRLTLGKEITLNIQRL
jgi:hypothetical protein